MTGKTPISRRTCTWQLETPISTAANGIALYGSLKPERDSPGEIRQLKRTAASEPSGNPSICPLNRSQGSPCRDRQRRTGAISRKSERARRKPRSLFFQPAIHPPGQFRYCSFHQLPNIFKGPVFRPQSHSLCLAQRPSPTPISQSNTSSTAHSFHQEGDQQQTS